MKQTSPSNSLILTTCLGLFIYFFAWSKTHLGQKPNQKEAISFPRANFSFQASGLGFGLIQKKTIQVGGLAREYLIEVPPKPKGGKQPLLIQLHGGGGKAKIDRNTRRFQGIRIAPQGIEKSWNIEGLPRGRVLQLWDGPDDIAFLRALIQHAIDKEGADPQKLVLLGISRGGMLVSYALSELNDLVCGGVIAIASMPGHIREGIQLPKPVHIMFMNGTEDPLIYYDGGNGGGIEYDGTEFENYQTLATEALAKDLAHLMKLPKEPQITELEGSRDELCRASVLEWKGGPNQGSVTVIKVIGGGHNIPGSVHFFPKFLVGPTCKSFKGMEVIFDFLNRIPPRLE